MESPRNIVSHYWYLHGSLALMVSNLLILDFIDDSDMSWVALLAVEVVGHFFLKVWRLESYILVNVNDCLLERVVSGSWSTGDELIILEECVIGHPQLNYIYCLSSLLLRVINVSCLRYIQYLQYCPHVKQSAWMHQDYVAYY